MIIIRSRFESNQNLQYSFLKNYDITKLQKDIFTLRHFLCLVDLSSKSKFSHISIRLQADSNILASPEAGLGNCLPSVFRLRRFPASQEDKYKDKIKILKIKQMFRLATIKSFNWCLPVQVLVRTTSLRCFSRNAFTKSFFQRQRLKVCTNPSASLFNAG